MQQNINTGGQKEIYKAIHNAKKSFPAIHFDMAVDAGTKKYEYATYNKVIDCIDKSMSENGLLIMHDSDDDNPQIVFQLMKKSLYKNTPIVEVTEVFQLLKVKTRIIHVETGEEISITIPHWFAHDKNGLQSMGGALTYLKRYGITTLLGIQAEKDIDGNEQNLKDDIKPIQRQNKPVNQTPAVNVTENDFINKIQPVMLKSGTKEAAIDWFKKQIESRKDLVFSDAVKKLASNAIKNHYAPKNQEQHKGFEEQKPAWIENCVNDFHLAKNVNALLDVKAYFENDIGKLPKNTPLHNRVMSEFESAMNVLERHKEPLHDNVIPFNKGVKQQDDYDHRGWENDPVFNYYGNRG